MEVKGKKYLQVLDKKKEELKEFKRNVMLGEITIDKKKYVRIDMDKLEKMVQDICELEYLDQSIKDGASKLVQFGIINMRLEERRS